MRSQHPWRAEDLGAALASIDAGWSPACIEQPPSTGQWGILKVSAVTSGRFKREEAKTLPEDLSPRSEIAVKRGDVVMARANGVAALVGVAAQVRDETERLMLSDKLLRLNPNLQLLTHDYLASLMSSSDVRAQLDRVLSGSSGQRNISQAQVRALRVQLPPLPEQRRIAEILDTLDETIRKTEQLIAKLKQVKQGLLHDLLTRGIDDNGELRDPVRHPDQFKGSPFGYIPTSWEAGPLGGAADLVDPNPSHRYPRVVSRGVPIASTENFVGDNDFDLTFSTHVPENVFVEQDRRCQFHTQDVVFARKGRLGFARPYGTEKKVFSHTVVLMKPKVGRSVHRFLLWSVRAESFFDGIRVRMNTNLGVPTLGVGFLASVPIAVPPVAEQKILADVLDSADARIVAEGMELVKLRQLKHGLMENLLTGRVRVTGLLTEGAA